MKNVMLDLETMSTSNNAAVIQIGAVYFDFTGRTSKDLSINIDLSTEMTSGFGVDASTIQWWMNQSEEARKFIFGDPLVKSAEAWMNLDQFLMSAESIWSHAMFDGVIIMNHFKKLFSRFNTSYRIMRDIRTLISLSRMDLDKWKEENPRSPDNIAHTALDDCYYQIRYCCYAMSLL